MAVGGNEDGLIGFLWINPSRRVRGGKKTPPATTGAIPHTGAQKHSRLPLELLMKVCVFSAP